MKYVTVSSWTFCCSSICGSSHRMRGFVCWGIPTKFSDFVWSYCCCRCWTSTRHKQAGWRALQRQLSFGGLEHLRRNCALTMHTWERNENPYDHTTHWIKNIHLTWMGWCFISEGFWAHGKHSDYVNINATPSDPAAAQLVLVPHVPVYCHCFVPHPTYNWSHTVFHSAGGK